MLVFTKKLFHTESLILSCLLSGTSLNAIPLSCISMKNQECQVRPEIISTEPVLNPYLILLVLKQVNVVAVVVILMIHMQKYVFLML